MNFFRRILSVLLCVCMLCGCSGGFAENVGDTLVVGILSTKTNALRPFEPKERELVSVYNIMYDSLIQIDDNGLPQPKLAESWAEVGSGKTWVFYLRKDVTFSDGSPLTAADVEASANYILSLATDEGVADHGFYASMQYIIESVKATDDYTVTVKTRRGSYEILYAMTFPVVKAEQVAEDCPLGSGPYVVSQFEPGSYLMLDFNTNWWQLPPQVRSISVMMYPNNSELISAYQYGRVDAVFTRSVAAAQYKSGTSSLSISYNTRQLETLMINHRTRSFPLDSLYVRQAIRYAINLDLIASNVYMGMTQDADAMIPSDSWLYLDQESKFVYNPDKARELLAEDGWVDIDENGVLDKFVGDEPEPKHLRLSLYVYEDPYNDLRYEAANMIASDLANVGIDIHVETVSYEHCKEVLQNGTFDLCLCAWQLDVVPDYGFLLMKNQGTNVGRYNSSPMDSMYTTLRSVTDQAEFAYTAQSIQQQFYEDVPFICLFYRRGIILTRKMFTTVRTVREFELFRGIETFGK